MNKKQYIRALKFRNFILKISGNKWYKLSDDIYILNKLNHE